MIRTPHAIRVTPLLAALLCFGSSAAAQWIDPVGVAPTPGGLVVQVGLEPHLVMSLGYLRGVHRQGTRRGTGLGAGVKLSPYLIRSGSGRLNVIATGNWSSAGSWGVRASTEAYLARGSNRAGTIHGFGLEVRAAPGYHAASWSVAMDMGWQGTLLSHVRHSDAAQEAFDERYPDGFAPAEGPLDGWYGSTAHRFRLGMSGGRRLADGLDLRVAAGSRFSMQRQGILLGFAHGQVPVYLETSLHFGR
jgi:hypothetical protein